ncbi:siderophore-interacting protein [Streptomyces sp. NBC_01619]|nr:siderophore-interacting protein [Streptomyces sp. NBC_00259]MCX4511033.1 siderophore-interacting protein [Streptomyces sp. NBC_01619]
MVRITFGGPDLAGFDLAGPDQQVKLYFPRPGQQVPLLPASGAGADDDVMRWYAAYNEIPEAERPWMPSYTVRASDTRRGTIDINPSAAGTPTAGPRPVVRFGGFSNSA